MSPARPSEHECSQVATFDELRGDLGSMSSRLANSERVLHELKDTIGHAPDSSTGRAGSGIAGVVAKLHDYMQDERRRAEDERQKAQERDRESERRYKRIQALAAAFAILSALTVTTANLHGCTGRSSAAETPSAGFVVSDSGVAH